MSKVLITSFSLVHSSLLHCFGTDKRDASHNPPGGLTADQVPMFVSFGFDDNGYSGLEGSGGTGGVKFVLDIFNSRGNPAGKGNVKTYDGTQVLTTFYLKANNIDKNSLENNALLKKVWRQAMENGNEVGVHTYAHKHGVEIDWDNMVKKDIFKVADWVKEINLCIEWLTKPYDPDVQQDDSSKGIGIKKSDIIGFRTPFLEYNDDTFRAIKKTGLIYDCSIEEGWQEDQDGRNFLWPYTLDNSSPGEACTAEMDFGHKPYVGKYPGLWELPSYAVIVPPDELCKKYGVKKGFRDRMFKEQSYFNTNDGKVTGLDWNLWFEWYMTKAEFLATLKYTLDLRLEGNRCPLFFGVHSDIYSSKYEENDIEEGTPVNATVQERRAALKEFLEYALTKPQVRVTSMKNILSWLKNPLAL
ncbi:MAG: hypothetical protein WA120_01930 [Candidatus Hydromicrobium sp.]